MDLTVFGTVSLGTLIEELSKIQDNALKMPVYVSMFGMSPSGVDSYRGYYDHLAIQCRYDHDVMTVKEFLDKLRFSVGAVFTGYKGGEYRMNKNTPVWVSRYGCADGNQIVGLHVNDYRVILKVRHEE